MAKHSRLSGGTYEKSASVETPASVCEVWWNMTSSSAFAATTENVFERRETKTVRSRVFDTMA